ncbi:MAG: toll/interleukin-1 receptor domain-containing protein [Opitutaceae bacterium]|nr:toll/interleukin-1 receptor domain-containing protein [Opitutaceae bacterium]
MSSAGTGSAPPRPSVFISYASEDRSAARTLRDALAAAGIDVWYDESDLTGGDAWDQKIRRQIRDCDYFMPVVSATTERRKEGYFRREWRLAVERTLDMADDVLFLLPIAIDDTSEATARVPEKFLAVQWLRLPSGLPSPALDALAKRLLSGDHTPLTRAPWSPRTRPSKPNVCLPPPLVEICTPTPPDPAAPPPMPTFPHTPEKGGFFHGVRFMAEVLWWGLTAVWLLFNRLPKWGRVLVLIWVVSTLFLGKCSRPLDRGYNAPERPNPARAPEREKKARLLADRISKSAREGGIALNSAEISKLGNEIAQVFVDGFGDAPAGPAKPLLIVPFAPPTAEDAPSKFAHAVFLSLYGRLSLDRRGEVSVTAPIAAGGVTPARARQLGSNFVLSATPASDGTTAGLAVQLVATGDGKVVWTQTFPVTGSDPTAIAEQIANHVLRLVPKKVMRRGK